VKTRNKIEIAILMTIKEMSGKIHPAKKINAFAFK
jgi:hypothetical protein